MGVFENWGKSRRARKRARQQRKTARQSSRQARKMVRKEGRFSEAAVAGRQQLWGKGMDIAGELGSQALAAYTGDDAPRDTTLDYYPSSSEGSSEPGFFDFDDPMTLVGLAAVVGLGIYFVTKK